MRQHINKFQKGFTLIELLVVMGILAVLLAIVLVAINPGRQFAQANNTQRNSDVGNILKAIYQYAADNRGNLPPGTPDQGASQIMTSATDVTTGTTQGTGVQFCNALVPTYIAALPRDPSDTAAAYVDCSSYNTRYNLTVGTASASTPRITVSAPSSQLGVTISVTN